MSLMFPEAGLLYVGVRSAYDVQVLHKLATRCISFENRQVLVPLCRRYALQMVSWKLEGKTAETVETIHTYIFTDECRRQNQAGFPVREQS